MVNVDNVKQEQSSTLETDPEREEFSDSQKTNQIIKHVSSNDNCPQTSSNDIVCIMSNELEFENGIFQDDNWSGNMSSSSLFDRL